MLLSKLFSLLIGLGHKEVPLNQIILDHKKLNELDGSNTPAAHIISISLKGLDQAKIKARL
jgi:hypothetical protein